MYNCKTFRCNNRRSTSALYGRMLCGQHSDESHSHCFVLTIMGSRTRGSCRNAALKQNVIYCHVQLHAVGSGRARKPLLGRQVLHLQPRIRNPACAQDAAFAGHEAEGVINCSLFGDCQFCTAASLLFERGHPYTVLRTVQESDEVQKHS